MILHLPKPYPDEILYSVIARYLVHTGGLSATLLHKNFFGILSKPQVDLPGGLDLLAEATWPTWKMTGEEIANNLTLLPYYSRYLQSDKINKYLQLLKCQEIGQFRKSITVNGNRVLQQRHLRYCKTCKEIDLNCYGETYWRRHHQIQGVLICTKHDELLLEIGLPSKSQSKPQYLDATICANESSAINIPTLSIDNIHKAKLIAQRCEEILNKTETHWPIENIFYCYRRSAHKIGVPAFFRKMSGNRLIGTFCDFYDDELLIKLGINIYKKNCLQWIQDIYKTNSPSLHPLEHTLIQIILENTPKFDYTKNEDNGKWLKCPKKNSFHGYGHYIDNLEQYEDKNGIYILSGKCICGFTIHLKSRKRLKEPCKKPVTMEFLYSLVKE